MIEHGSVLTRIERLDFARTSMSKDHVEQLPKDNEGPINSIQICASGPLPNRRQDVSMRTE